MGKKSKKSKHKKSSSSSSEEDEKVSKKQDATKRDRSPKRKLNSQDSGAAKCETCAFPTIKDASQSTRQIKKPVYRLAKTQATDQKPVKKEEERTESISVPFHEDHCSSKAKNYISWKYTVGGSKTVERGSSKSLNTNNAVAVPQRTEGMSKSSFDEKSSQRGTSKLNEQLMSTSQVLAKQKEQLQNVLKRKCRAEEPPRTEKDRNTVKTREPSKKSSVSKDSERHKRSSLSREAKTPASTTKQSSTSAKHTFSVSSTHAVKNLTSVPETAKSSLLTSNFKIPKMVHPKPLYSTGEKKDAISTELSKSGAEMKNSKQGTVQQAHSYSDVSPSFSSKGRDERLSLPDRFSATFDTVTELCYDQMQVVKELHLARSDKRLEVNVMQTYGELTCMDIDPSEEGAADTRCKQTPQQDLILVLDTNILLSHLDYVKKIRSHGLGALGFPVVLIPWVVLQEMDSLKRGKGLSGSVAHLATPAISYIYNSLKSRESHLWGQSMQQATEINNGLNAENNDDRVLQCCLQYQSLYPECALILCTNDKNLCSKALLSGVKALSKNDLEAEVGMSRHGFHPLQNIKPHINPQVSSPMQSISCTSVQPHSQERPGLSAELLQKVNKCLSKKEDEGKTAWLSGCVSELEDCLREVLSDVLELEMKAAYEDIWLEIVYLKPPWTLQDVLQCLKKHWIAVFGHVVPRTKLQNVLNLITFFNSGKAVNCSTTLTALQEAKELVKAFGKSSSHIPKAISVMDNIFNKLQPQDESPAWDGVMNDDDHGEDEQPVPVQVSHQEVWALFENIWSNVLQISMEVFKALSFDPHTMQSAQPVGGPPPPQDALVCLHKLSSMVSQLLQAFSSVLSSAPGLEEVQTLLSIIHSNEIVHMDSRLTAKDLLNCFSQEDYREKLRAGGNKLMELKGALDRCVQTTGQHITFPTLC